MLCVSEAERLLLQTNKKMPLFVVDLCAYDSTHSTYKSTHTYTDAPSVATKECCCCCCCGGGGCVADSRECIQTIGLAILYSGRERAGAWPLLYGSCPVRLPLTCEHMKSSAGCPRARCNRYDVQQMLPMCLAAAVLLLLLLLPGLQSEMCGSCIDLARCDSRAHLIEGHRKSVFCFFFTIELKIPSKYGSVSYRGTT